MIGASSSDPGSAAGVRTWGLPGGGSAVSESGGSARKLEIRSNSSCLALVVGEQDRAGRDRWEHGRVAEPLEEVVPCDVARVQLAMLGGELMFPMVLAGAALATPGSGILGAIVHARGTNAEELNIHSAHGVKLKTKSPVDFVTQ
jgi:hypothetical protein